MGVLSLPCTRYKQAAMFTRRGDHSSTDRGPRIGNGRRHRAMTIPETENQRTRTETPDISNVLSLLAGRILATANVAKAILALASSEVRLALSSVGMMSVLCIALIVMLPITWLVLLATAFQALVASGLGPLAAMAWLLLFQLAVCVLLGGLLYRLASFLRFERTRQAIATLTSDPIPETDPASAPVPAPSPAPDFDHHRDPS